MYVHVYNIQPSQSSFGILVILLCISGYFNVRPHLKGISSVTPLPVGMKWSLFSGQTLVKFLTLIKSMINCLP